MIVSLLWLLLSLEIPMKCLLDNLKLSSVSFNYTVLIFISFLPSILNTEYVPQCHFQFILLLFKYIQFRTDLFQWGFISGTLPFIANIYTGFYCMHLLLLHFTGFVSFLIINWNYFFNYLRFLNLLFNSFFQTLKGISPRTNFYSEIDIVGSLC